MRRIHPGLAVLTGLLLLTGGILFYVHGEIADEQAFSARLSSALDDARVRTVVTDRTVDALVSASGGHLLLVRPLVTRVMASLVASSAVRRLAAAATTQAHRALLAPDRSLVIQLAGAGPTLLAALRSVSPALAATAAEAVQPVLATVRKDDGELSVIRRAVDASGWGLWLLLAAAGIAAAALIRSRDRCRTGAHLCAALAVAGALTAALVVLGGALASGHVGGAGAEPRRAAVSAVWDALFGDLRTAALVAGAGGLVGLVLLAVGLQQRVRDGGRVPDGGHASDGGRVRAGRRLWAGASLVVVAGAAALAFVIASSAPAPAQAAAAPSAGCNGLPSLCDRRLDEVVFAATHNSMAAADEPGWLFANQRYPIARQLKDGIRALLIDVHFGVLDPRTGRVRTDLRAEGSSRNKVAQQLSPQALQMADRLAGRVGAGDLNGTAEPYLCHTLCELGAEPLDQELTVIRTFLEQHPTQLLVVIVEDYVPPQEIERAFERTGLLQYTATLRRDEPLPTLGELISSGKRLVTFAEEKGGTPPWYMPAFSFIQDTPLGATRPDQLSCTRYRGDADSPMLMINHWIPPFPPLPSENARIGTAAFLRERIERCETARGVRGAIVAVDFYERGAAVAVARELNRGG